MHTQVGIIGSGPAGLLLSRLLQCAGIESVILEQRSRKYVEARIRAGVLESGTVKLLEQARAADRLHREGIVHEGVELAYDGRRLHIDFVGLADDTVVVYGQTEVTHDLIEAVLADGGVITYEAENVAIHDLDGDRPRLSYIKDGEPGELSCDFVAGCDGYHGVSRTMIPDDILRTYERGYPFGWLGILADVPPMNEELVYANSERGFALASMRSHTRSRYYVQCGLDENLDEWSDDRIWDELARRFGPEHAGNITRGPSIEKSIAPLRSFVAEPMQYQKLFLAGDAAHIVPPTGAKGLNLAASDVHYLFEALLHRYRKGDESKLKSYSGDCLRRVWKAERFSWWMTSLLHKMYEPGSFEEQMQRAEFEYLLGSERARASLAENYVGLPF